MVLCVLFIRLGLWQFERGNARQEEWTRFARGADKAVTVDSGNIASLPRFQRVEITGRFDAEHQFLLDNRTYNGRAGYEVLTPLETPGPSRANGQSLLIDRGWVPFTGRRDTLPNVAFEPRGEVLVKGRTDNLPAAGLAVGRAAPPKGGGWPKLTSYPTMGELSAVLGRPLEPRIVLLDAQEPNGYVRDWRPPGMPPLRHWSYAIQWWCFAVVVVVFWVILSRRRPSIPMSK